MRSFRVDLAGKPPFRFEYAHSFTDLSGISVPMSKQFIDVDTSFIRQAIDISKPGTHIYKLISVSDHHYQYPIKPSLHSQNIFAVQQNVNPSPIAVFIDTQPRIVHCISKAIGDFELSMKLVGEPPFELEIEETRDNIHISTINKLIPIEELSPIAEDGLKSYRYLLQTEGQSHMGKYQYIISSVKDSAGCSSTFERDNGAPGTLTTIEIADQAKITAINPSIVCVGDIIAFNLQGTPPFTVGYSFNGEKQSDIEIVDPLLSLWAGVEGNLTITKVCNAMQCCDKDVSSDPLMTTAIKGLPKVNSYCNVIGYSRWW